MEDEEWEYLVALRLKVKDGEEMIATKPAAITGVIAYNDYLEDIDDPDNSNDSTSKDFNAVEAAGKAVADALWPPTKVLIRCIFFAFFSYLMFDVLFPPFHI